MSDVGTSASRLHELEARFAELGEAIEDSPVRDALSVLHGIIHEVGGRSAPLADDDAHDGPSMQALVDLHRHAPPMEGEAVSAGLPVGSPAPEFALPDAAGRIVRLSDFRGAPVVLVFYPLDWSPGCSRQLDLYQQELDEFRRRGAAVVGISVDSIYSHGAWALARGLELPLLADFHPKGEVARRYQVWREPDGFSERALFVVDGAGTIRYAHVAPHVHHLPDVYELFRALDEVVAAPSAA